MMPPVVQRLLASASRIVSPLLFIAWFVADAIYQLRQGNYAQAAGAVLIVGLLVYVLVTAVRDAAIGIESPIRRRVGGWTPPRTPATTALLVMCIVATIVAWFLPNNWYIVEGTVGRTGVLQHHEWWRLVTSAFLHANTTHLYVDMLALWVLGREMESALGTPRLLAVYLGAALGSGLTVVAAGQERTLGASGAIYGLLGAAFYFGLHALRAGHRKVAKRMLLGTGGLIAVNLLFTFSVPNISMAAHVGGLLTGLLIAVAFGVPARLNDAWALSDHCTPPTHFTYDANTNVFCYHGPARFAVEAGLVEPNALATSVDKNSWPQYAHLLELDVDTTPIDCDIEDPEKLFDYVCKTQGITLGRGKSTPADASQPGLLANDRA